MTTVIQRPLRGSRISTFYPIKNLPSLASLDSAFQLQEYISLLIRLDVHDVNAIVCLPGTAPSGAKDKENEGYESIERKIYERRKGVSEKDGDGDKGKGEPAVDEACWIYEQLRRLAQDLSHPLITTLQQECTRASCPEMKAGEWLYLCVAHGNDGAMEHCCAIDYILHTVDSATALLNSPRTFPSRLQIPVASHRHFSSLARRLGRIFAHAYFHHREAFEQAEAESSLYARFLALTERFDLVPAEFLVIPTDGSHVGGVGDSLGLGPPPSRSAREDHRQLNDYDRGYHQRPQQRARYDLELVNFHDPEPSIQHHLHPNPLERDPSPPGPSSSDSGSSNIGEFPSPSTRARFGRNRTGTMVFAEAEATAVTDELARSSMRERERELPKIELLERDGDTVALKTVAIPPIPSSVHEDEEIQFEISLSPEDEVGKSGEGGSDVTREVFEESPGPVEKHEPPSLLDLDLGMEAAGNVIVLPSAPAEVEAAEASFHPSTVSSKPVEREEEVTPASTSDIVADQPKEEPVASVKPATAILTKVKSDETQLIPTTTTDVPPADDNVSIPEPTLIPKETPETAIASTFHQEVATKPDVADDKETVTTSVIIDDVSPAIVPQAMKIEPTNELLSLDEVPVDKTQPEVTVVESSADVGNTVTKEEKGKETSDSITIEEGKTEEEKKM